MIQNNNKIQLITYNRGGGVKTLKNNVGSRENIAIGIITKWNRTVHCVRIMYDGY